MQWVIRAWAWNWIHRLFCWSTFYWYSLRIFSKILILIIVPGSRNSINLLIISSCSLYIWWFCSCFDHLISGVIGSWTWSGLIKFYIVSLGHRIFWSLTSYILSNFILSWANIVAFVQLVRSWSFRKLISSKRTLSWASNAIATFLRILCKLCLSFFHRFPTTLDQK